MAKPDLKSYRDRMDKSVASLKEDYAALGANLARRGIDIDAITRKVAEFFVAVPSWGVGTGGTRFARFPGAGEPRGIFDKLDDCACAYKGLIAEAKEIKAEETALAARRKAKENEAARLASYIDHCLKDSAGDGVKPEKFETARNVLSYRASEAVDVPDVESVVLWIQAHEGEAVGGVAVDQRAQGLHLGGDASCQVRQACDEAHGNS